MNVFFFIMFISIFKLFNLMFILKNLSRANGIDICLRKLTMVARSAD